MPAISFPKAIYEDYFVTWYQPDDGDLFAQNSTIISEGDKELIRDLAINSNPVLVFYTIKSF